MEIDINKAIDQLADGLGIAVDKLYPVLYKQAMIDAAMNIFWALLLLIGIAMFIVLVRLVNKKKE
ncbi:hypothetical protein ACW2QC_09305 [Virgibacillus sp. FSP13]